jgi:hypothetical protein
MHCHCDNFLKPTYIVPTLFYSLKNDEWPVDRRESFYDKMCPGCDVELLKDGRENVVGASFFRFYVRRLMLRRNVRQGLFRRSLCFSLCNF